jgi:hypothetical protein
MTRKKRHHGRTYVEPIVYWIVYHPGKNEKKLRHAATYFEAFDERTSTWGVEKARAIRFFSHELAEQAFKEAAAAWKDRAYPDGFMIVPADTVIG